MESEAGIYRRLRQHLDNRAIGFPATKSGADINLLKRLFSSDEARLALYIPCKPIPLDTIIELASPEFSTEQIELLLESMFRKGAIGWKKKNGMDHWHVMPLIIGMYEHQDGESCQEFLRDMFTCLENRAFVKSFLAATPPQARTIPINASIRVQHHMATYDHIRAIVDASRGPFVALKCICREVALKKNRFRQH